MSRTLAALRPVVTDRLILEPLAASDAPDVRALTDNQEIIRRVDFLASPFTLADAVALIARNGTGDECFLAIRDRRLRDLLGVIGTHFRGPEEVEIGYWLGAAHHGQGYATEAVGGLIVVLRDVCPERRVIAECDPQNTRSWRVLDKAGFRPTGRSGHRPGRQLLALAG